MSLDQTRACKSEGDLQVAFAPDFRDLVPYQKLLADALNAQHVQVQHLRGYRRVMPLYRSVRGLPVDLLHIHFPVHYVLQRRKLDGLRKLRFPLDLWLTSQQFPIVYTIHDLYPLDHVEDFLIRAGTEYLLKRSSAIIVHSSVAAERIRALSQSFYEKCAVIPHGDLADAYGAPLDREEAKAFLKVEQGRICLALGIITENKGIEELIAFWQRHRPDAALWIVGNPKSPAYGRTLQALARDVSNVYFRLEFQSDEEIRAWFSASDCVIINYRKIFTSGIASFARSYGVPILIAKRHKTIDLQEPHPSVFRYHDLEASFLENLHRALSFESNYSSAKEWRESIAWPKIATLTRRVYDEVLEK